MKIKDLINNYNAQIDPAMIMSAIVALVILAVGIFAFFATLSAVEDGLNESKATEDTTHNLGEVGTDVFNIIGVVLVIGAVMAVVGMVYAYVRPSYSPPSPKPQIKMSDIDDTVEKEVKPKYPRVPQNIGDYKLYKVTDVDDALETAKELRGSRYWTKLTKYTHRKYNLPATKNCAVYVSNWTKDDSDNGKPKWRYV